jgi:hypothetical protein
MLPINIILYTFGSVIVQIPVKQEIGRAHV